jgi:hypothetical protein
MLEKGDAKTGKKIGVNWVEGMLPFVDSGSVSHRLAIFSHSV